MKKLVVLLYAVFLLSILAPIASFSQKMSEEDIKKNLPKMLGANNIGKEFWFSIPPCALDWSAGFPNFIKLYITAATKTLVTIEVPGKGYKNLKMTIPNDVIEVNIEPTVGQAYNHDPYKVAPPETVYPGAGIHVYADDPLVVYCIVRYQATSDGFLALPVSSLGREYIVATYPDMSAMYPSWKDFPSEVTITAAYDNTDVLFTIGGNVLTKTSGGNKTGTTLQATMNAGDVWTFATTGDEADLTGSKVRSSKPVGVVSANYCANIPTMNRWCDYCVEMDIPTFTWGKVLHVGKIPSRKYPSIVRIFAKEPNTLIFRDGKQIGSIQAAGGVISRAYLEMRMVGMNEQPRSIVLSGDKPIGVTLYNCGTEEDQNNNYNSDPFFMAITPIEQYQKEITFCTPGIYGATGFPENYLNLVYETDEYGLMPDDVEFAEVQSGQYIWSKVRSKFAGIDELFRYDIDGKKYALKMITLPHDGVYKIRAKKPFACYSFGFSFCDSYGYPTSAALADLEKPDTIPPLPIWKAECDGTIKGATVTDKPDDPTIRSNLSMIVFNKLESFNYTFKYDPFVPGQSPDTKWEAEVIDKTKDARAVIIFTDRRGNDTTITIDYFATKLTIRPEYKDFGLHKAGAVVQQKFWAINESKESSADIYRLELKNKNQGFELVLPFNLPYLKLKPMDSVEFFVKFTATESGEFKDSIGIGDTCIFAFKSFVKAKVDEPGIEVSDINFGDVTVGKTVQKEMQIKNIGRADLVITGYVGPSLSVYTTNLPSISQATPLILKPDEIYTFKVNFTPDAEKEYPDQILFNNDAKRVDSIGLILGRGIKPGLLANGYDWGRRRIDRPAFPAGPYPPDPGNDVIKLENNGSEKVQIIGINIKSDINGSAFEFDRNKFNGMEIQPNSSVIVPVKFHPVQVGNHELVFTYENSAGSPTETRLAGIGILPKISTSDYDFDTTIVFDYSDVQTRTIRITNEEYEWQDKVTIEELIVGASADAINKDLNAWGKEGFRYNESALNLPLTLQPGESLEFPAEFVAQKVKDANATLTTKSDAETEVTSKWHGYGTSQSISTEGGSSRICIYTQAIIKTKIINTGFGEVEILSLGFDPIDPSFVFNNPLDAQGFTLKGGETREVEILYVPTAVGTKSVDVLVRTNILGADSLKRIKIEGTAVHFDRTTTVEVPEGSKNPIIGQVVYSSIRLNDGNDIAFAGVTDLTVTVEYFGDFMQAIRENIGVGADFAGKLELQNLVIDDTAGKITFDLKAIGNYVLTGSGELVKLAFRTYLPTNNQRIDSSFINATVKVNRNLCLDITGSKNEIRLKPTCVYDLRWVIVTGVDYALNQISPNPVGSSGTDIKFSVGLEGWTELQIINTLGEVVAVPVSERLKPGEYSVRVPVDNLPSGTYIVRMVSGQYTQTVQMVVNK